MTREEALTLISEIKQAGDLSNYEKEFLHLMDVLLQIHGPTDKQASKINEIHSLKV